MDNILQDFQKTELLRIHLRLAFYKVQTNQTNKPFSRLQLPRTSSPELPPQPPQIMQTDPEAIVAGARLRATLQQKPVLKSLNSMPVPVIVPTAYSVKQMEIPALDHPSSPPPSDRSTSAWLNQEPGTGIGTPAQMDGTRRKQSHRHPSTPTQLSSPPGSDSGGHRDQWIQSGPPAGASVSGLTSSVVKGEAADSLLRLMQAGATGDKDKRVSN